jgi:hypothetical protein
LLVGCFVSFNWKLSMSTGAGMYCH